MDRRSEHWYLLLSELPNGHPYQSYIWSLFRYPEWLEAGSAWLQAKYIAEDLETFARISGVTYELRPVVGSGNPSFDEALGQALITFGLRPIVAELFPTTA